jgi:hypothetical protein
VIRAGSAVAAAAAEPEGGPGGDSTAAAGEWFAAYTAYLKRAADQSSETIALYQEVTDRVVRGDLAPTATQDMLNSFVQARGTVYSEQVGELLLRFFTEMVRISTTFANELGQEVLPGAAAAAHIPRLSFDTGDPAAWFAQLNEFAQRLGASIGAVYQSLIDRAAAGDLERGKLEDATAGYMQRRLPKLLAELSTLYFGLLNGLTDLRIRAEREYLRGVLESSGATNGAAPFELSLRAPLGETATASVSIENTREDTARIRCLVRDIRRADGVGPALAPDLNFEQDELTLAPGEQATLGIRLALEPGKFEAGVRYVGTLEITGHGDPRLEVPLRIEPLEPSV